MAEQDSRYNNIFNKKNIEYALDGKKDELPYKNDSDVKLKANQIIFTSINNILQRLLDNDLYNEALLKKYIENGLIGGPTYIDSVSSVIERGSLNTKYIVSGDNGISVLRKEMDDVSKTLSGPFPKGVNLKTNKISFIDDKFIACTEKGIYESSNQTDWTRIAVGSTENEVIDITYNYGFLKSNVLSAYDFLAVVNTSSGAIFYGHRGTATRDKWSVIPNLILNDVEATSIFSFENDDNLYVGTKLKGLLSIKLLGSNRDSTVQFGTEKWTINDMVEVPNMDENEKYFLATNYGIKQLHGHYGFKELKKILSSTKGVYDAIETNNGIYAATSNGTYYISKSDPSSSTQYLAGTVCYSIVPMGFAVFVGTNAGVYSIENGAEQLFDRGGEAITKIGALNDNVLFAYSSTEKKILYSRNKGAFSEVDLTPSMADDEFVKEFVKHGDTMYALTNKRIYALKDGALIHAFLFSDSIIGNSDAMFAKTFANGSTIIQSNDEVVYADQHGYEIFRKELPSGTFKVTDAARVDYNGVEEILLLIDGYLYKLYSTGEEIMLDPVRIDETPITGQKICVYSKDDFYGIVCLSEDGNLKCFQYDEYFGVLYQVSENEIFSDSLAYENGIYSISESNGNIERFELKNTLTAISTVEITGNCGVSFKEYPNDVYLSTYLSSINIELPGAEHPITAEVASSDGLEFSESDFIGYIGNKNDEKTVLAASRNGLLTAYSLEIDENNKIQNISKINVKNPPYGLETFEDAYYIDPNTGIITNAMNFAGGDGLYAIQAKKDFCNLAIPTEITAINSATDIAGHVFIGTNNGVYILDTALSNNFATYGSYFSPVYSVINQDDALYASSTGPNILLTANGTDEADIAKWIPAYKSEYGDEFVTVTYPDTPDEQDEDEPPTVRDLTANYGGVLKVTEKTISIKDRISESVLAILNAPVKCRHIADNTFVNSLSTLYYEDGRIKAESVYGDLYELTGFYEDNGEVYFGTKTLNEYAKNPESILEEKRANFMKIEDNLSIEEDLDNIEDIFDYFGSVEETSKISKSSDNSIVINDVDSLNADLLSIDGTPDLLFNDGKTRFYSSPYLYLTADFDEDERTIDSLDAVEIISFKGEFLTSDEQEEPTLSTIVISSLFHLTPDNATASLLDSDEIFRRTVSQYPLCSESNFYYTVSLSVGNFEYANNIDFDGGSIKINYSAYADIEVPTYIPRRLPYIQETNDEIYYSRAYITSSIADDGVEETTRIDIPGYCILSDIDGLAKTHLLFTTTPTSGFAMYAFDGFNVNRLQNKIAFTNISRSEFTNAFNDLYYFNCTDPYEENPIRKTVLGAHDKDFSVAKYSAESGNIVKTTFEDSCLYVLKDSEAYAMLNSEFPGFTKIADNVKWIDSSQNYTLIIGNNEDISAYANGIFKSSTHIDGAIKDVFHNSSNVFVSTESGIFKSELNGSSITFVKYSSFNKRDNIKFALDRSDSNNIRAVIGDAYLYGEQSVYDFEEDGYSEIDNLDSTIVSLKTLSGNSSTPILYAATSNGIWEYVFNGFEDGLSTYTKRLKSNGLNLSNVKAMYFNNTNDLYLIDGKDLYLFLNTSAETQLTDNDFTLYEDFFNNKIEHLYMGDFKEFAPAIDTCSAIYTIDSTKRFKKTCSVANPDSSSSRLLNSSSHPYLYTNSILYMISSNEDTGEFLLDSFGDYSNTQLCSSGPMTVEENGTRIDLWAISDNGSISDIRVSRNGRTDISSYKVIGNGDVNSLFFMDDSIKAAVSKNRGGIYKLATMDNVVVDDEDPVAIKSGELYGNELFSLAFYKNSYIINHRNNILGILAFSSNDETIAKEINKNYNSANPAIVMATLFDRYVFVSDGSYGYVYDVRGGRSGDISFSQLNSDGDSILTFIKDNNGLGLLGYGDRLYTFTGFDRIKEYGDVDPVNFMALANNFKRETNKIKVLNNKKDFLIGTDYGVKYVLDAFMTRSFYNRANETAIDGSVRAIAKVIDADNDELFIVGSGNELFEVTSLKETQFRRIHTFSSNECVLDIFALGKNEYIIATTKGIYVTSLRYTITNDLQRFTLDNIYDLINDELKKIIDKHIKTDHAASSLVTLINKKADNKLSFISTADLHKELYDSSIANSVKIVKDDIIDTIVRGGEDPNKESYVRVGVQNWALSRIQTKSTYTEDGFVNSFVDPTSGKEFDISTVPYIVKTWKSGIKEIYIYVPTTGTYYANNPQGISNSQYSYMSYERANVPGVSLQNSIPNACTTLRVYLYNSYFKIKSIIAAQCTGNSLPLKIYKDNVNADDAWKGVFDTVIQPSALRTLPVTVGSSVNNVGDCTDSLERIYLDFSIYGTDAQAIRIIAES